MKRNQQFAFGLAWGNGAHSQNFVERFGEQEDGTVEVDKYLVDRGEIICLLIMGFWYRRDYAGEIICL